MHSIDIHTHGIGGFDTRSSTVDDILRIAKIHGASGVSAIVLSIYSAPIETMRRQTELVRQAMENQRSAVSGQRSAENSQRDPLISNSTLHSTPSSRAARILGVHLEGPFLNPARCGALDPTSFIDAEEHAFRALMDGLEDIVKTITVAPECRGAPELIRKITDLGIVVGMGHSDATYAEAEAGFHAGARGITHLFNAMRAFHHREPGLAGFGLLNKDVYVEVLADPFHLHSRTIELIFQTKNPEKIVLVSDSVKETKSGGDGRGVTASGRLQGGAMTVSESARRLSQQGFDERIITDAITLNPRQYLMLEPFE
jgi:N-acetylglucosamine-6-phosphate deacetylase